MVSTRLGPTSLAVAGTLILGHKLFLMERIDRLTTFMLIGIISLAALLAGLIAGNRSRREILIWIKKSV